MERVVSALKVLRDVAKEFFSRYEKYGVSVITDVYYDNTIEAWFCIQVKNELEAIVVEAYYECRLTDPPVFTAVIKEGEMKIYGITPNATYMVDYIREYLEEMLGGSGEG